FLFDLLAVPFAIVQTDVLILICAFHHSLRDFLGVQFPPAGGGDDGGYSVAGRGCPPYRGRRNGIAAATSDAQVPEAHLLQGCGTAPCAQARHNRSLFSYKKTTGIIQPKEKQR
ncbi:Hypothetical protein, putative, partial [Bodo saltans]